MRAVMWAIGGVAVVALIAGVQAAVSLTKNVEHTVGVSTGAIVGGTPDLIAGFNEARTMAKHTPTHSHSQAPHHHHKHHHKHQQ